MLCKMYRAEQKTYEQQENKHRIKNYLEVYFKFGSLLRNYATYIH